MYLLQVVFMICQNHLKSLKKYKEINLVMYHRLTQEKEESHKSQRN